MIRFLTKTAFFVIFIIAFSLAYIYVFTNKYIDPFYYRFTTSKQYSLILGSSRAAQGLEPSIINEKLGLKKAKIFNYAFTAGRSPWGKPYFNAIKKKLKHNANIPSVFILEYNPWAMLSDSLKIGTFPESKAIPFKIHNPYTALNIQYFFGSYEDVNLRLLIKKFIGDKDKYVNIDGRYVIEMNFDSIQIEKRVNIKMRQYRQNNRVFDQERFLWFQKTIDYLKKYGNVYVVRFPVAEEMYHLEKKFSHNAFVSNYLDENDIPYFDFTFLNNKYITNDGNHLNYQFVPRFTESVADSILKNREMILNK